MSADTKVERLLDGERCDHLREPTLAEELAGDFPPEQCPFFAQWILDPESDTGPSQGASYRACDLHRPALEQLAREWATEEE